MEGKEPKTVFFLAFSPQLQHSVKIASSAPPPPPSKGKEKHSD